MLVAALTLCRLNPELPRPANFECDLLLISSARNYSEGDPEMTWATSRFDTKLPKAKIWYMDGEGRDPLAGGKAAVDEMATPQNPFVVIETSELKSSHYNALIRRKINILQRNPEQPRQQPPTLNLEFHRPASGGYGGTGFVYLGGNTRAKGLALKPNIVAPTFSIMGLRDLLGTAPEGRPNVKLPNPEVNIALAFSTLPVSETAELIDKENSQLNNICICAWGTQIPGRPNIIAAPPNGRAVRYKYGHKDGKWFANFVKAY